MLSPENLQERLALSRLTASAFPHAASVYVATENGELERKSWGWAHRRMAWSSSAAKFQMIAMSTHSSQHCRMLPWWALPWRTIEAGSQEHLRLGAAMGDAEA